MFLLGVIRSLTSFGSMLFVFVYIQKKSEGSSHVLGHIFHFYFRVFLEYVENPVKGTVRKSVLSAFYLPCKIWVFLHSAENFHQGEILFVKAANNFFHAAKFHIMQH